MPITAKYDREADALYIRLAKGERVRAMEIDNETYVDLDAEDRPIGIELLYPSMGLNINAVVARLALGSRLAEILNAVARSGAPVGSITITMPGGQYLASTSMIVSTAAATAAGLPPILRGGTASVRAEPVITADC